MDGWIPHSPIPGPNVETEADLGVIVNDKRYLFQQIPLWLSYADFKVMIDEVLELDPRSFQLSFKGRYLPDHGQLSSLDWSIKDTDFQMIPTNFEIAKQFPVPSAKNTTLVTLRVIPGNKEYQFFDVDMNWTIAHLKKLVGTQLDLDPSRIQILFAGKSLPDDETVDIVRWGEGVGYIILK